MISKNWQFHHAHFHLMSVHKFVLNFLPLQFQGTEKMIQFYCQKMEKTDARTDNRTDILWTKKLT